LLIAAMRLSPLVFRWMTTAEAQFATHEEAVDALE
jgi:hypothetical protein